MSTLAALYYLRIPRLRFFAGEAFQPASLPELPQTRDVFLAYNHFPGYRQVIVRTTT